ncbi:M23 family metallopeptidase [Arthrobacter caoxuetaonis]|uniref:M23 family metallopeptidase n=1 Tax=Arthrobacter caoxuetaonis TaxID=2886935 RepID=UPI001D1339F0|nr:M23 family metallopeptidase [Arthrobacter caoxuetaonis]MCC3284105.1 M23 family metallopeptidase [Arthrobacter caoxuetaonis]
MSKHAASGRRRAETPAAPLRPRSTDRSTGRRRAETVQRPLGASAQKLAIGAAASGLVLTVALPTTAAADIPMEQPTPSAAPAVSADPNATLSFDRAALTSKFDPDAKLQGLTVAGMDVTPAAAKGTLATPLESELVQTSSFGYRVSPITGAAGELHTGQDFAAACGTEVTAAASGTVTFAGWHALGGGNRVVLDHGNGVETTYNHLSAISVSVGDKVQRGHLVGASGSTGASTGCHLHFEVMVNGTAVDPLGWL